MSRAIAGVTYEGRDARPLKLSAVPWITITWSSGLVLGLALLTFAGSGSRDARPLALAAPASPPAVAGVESQVQELAERVQALEAEVAELRSPRVARTSLED